jgi:hypothetical protein
VFFPWTNREAHRSKKSPFMRRQGLLREAWPTFRALFGDFDVGEPLSPAMEAFLIAMRGVSPPS